MFNVERHSLGALTMKLAISSAYLKVCRKVRFKSCL